jgi:hypothetical protein
MCVDGAAVVVGFSVDVDGTTVVDAAVVGHALELGKSDEKGATVVETGAADVTRRGLPVVDSFSCCTGLMVLPASDFPLTDSSVTKQTIATAIRCIPLRGSHVL